MSIEKSPEKFTQPDLSIDQIISDFGLTAKDKLIVKKTLDKLWQEKYAQDPRIIKKGIKNVAELCQLLGPNFVRTFVEEKVQNGEIKPKLQLPARGKDALSGEQFFGEKLGARPDAGSEEEVRRVDGIKGDRRDALVLEEVAKGNIPEACRRFTPITLSNSQGTKITFQVMNRSLAIGDSENAVVVQGSPQLALGMKKYGVVMPTKTMVAAIYQRARQQGSAIAMPTQTPDEHMNGNGASIIKSRKLRPFYNQFPPDKLVAGEGKLKVVSAAAIRTGHEENGGLQADLASTIQNNAAHGGRDGIRYADYSSQFQGVYHQVLVEKADGSKEPISLEKALKNPELAAILNGTEGKLDYDSYYQKIFQESSSIVRPHLSL